MTHKNNKRNSQKFLAYLEKIERVLRVFNAGNSIKGHSAYNPILICRSRLKLSFEVTSLQHSSYNIHLFWLLMDTSERTYLRHAVSVTTVWNFKQDVREYFHSKHLKGFSAKHQYIQKDGRCCFTERCEDAESQIRLYVLNSIF